MCFLFVLILLFLYCRCCYFFNIPLFFMGYFFVLIMTFLLIVFLAFSVFYNFINKRIKMRDVFLRN